MFETSALTLFNVANLSFQLSWYYIITLLLHLANDNSFLSLNTFEKKFAELIATKQYPFCN